RGGVGAVLRLRVDIEEPAGANTAGDGVRHAPYGLLGGKDGLPHRYRLQSRGRTPRGLKNKEMGGPVRKGDVFLIGSSGAGGEGRGARGKGSRRARVSDRENGFVKENRRRFCRRRPRPISASPSRTRSADGSRSEAASCCRASAVRSSSRRSFASHSTR